MILYIDFIGGGVLCQFCRFDESSLECRETSPNFGRG